MFCKRGFNTVKTQPIHDVAVLFTHHADDATTRNNIAVLKHYNPDVPVIPISQWGVTLTGGYHARAMTAGWRKLLPSYRGHDIKGAIRRFRQQIDPRWVWRNADLSAYLWITWPKRPVQAKRWVIFEWDIYASVSVRDFYRDVWDEDIVRSF